MKAFSPYLRSVLRIVSALLLFQAGTMKMFGWPIGLPNGMHLVWRSELGVAAVLEVFGGGLLLLGLLTRPVAFLISGEMAVAYFQQHQPVAAWPIANQGQPAVLLCFIFLYLSAAGPGPLSLDRVVRKVD